MGKSVNIYILYTSAHTAHWLITCASCHVAVAHVMCKCITVVCCGHKYAPLVLCPSLYATHHRMSTSLRIWHLVFHSWDFNSINERAIVKIPLPPKHLDSGVQVHSY